MINLKRFTPVYVVAVVASMMTTAVAPTAIAADNATVVSSRSFPKTTAVQKDLLAEATATSVDKNSKWGSIESLDVPQTKSQAEKTTEAQAQAEAANRNQQRQSLTTTNNTTTTQQEEPTTTVVAGSATGQNIAAFASGYVGYPYVWGGTSPSGWDCSGFVMWVFSQFGISLPHSSGAMMGYGTGIASLNQAAPGDILVNGSHAAIYIGGGMVVNALNPYQGTMITSTAVFSGGFAIRRLV